MQVAFLTVGSKVGGTGLEMKLLGLNLDVLATPSQDLLMSATPDLGKLFLYQIACCIVRYILFC